MLDSIKKLFQLPVVEVEPTPRRLRFEFTQQQTSELVEVFTPSQIERGVYLPNEFGMVSGSLSDINYAYTPVLTSSMISGVVSSYPMSTGIITFDVSGVITPEMVVMMGAPVFSKEDIARVTEEINKPYIIPDVLVPGVL